MRLKITERRLGSFPIVQAEKDLRPNDQQSKPLLRSGRPPLDDLQRLQGRRIVLREIRERELRLIKPAQQRILGRRGIGRSFAEQEPEPAQVTESRLSIGRLPIQFARSRQERGSIDRSSVLQRFRRHFLKDVPDRQDHFIQPAHPRLVVGNERCQSHFLPVENGRHAPGSRLPTRSVIEGPSGAHDNTPSQRD